MGLRVTCGGNAIAICGQRIDNGDQLDAVHARELLSVKAAETTGPDDGNAEIIHIMRPVAFRGRDRACLRAGPE